MTQEKFKKYVFFLILSIFFATIGAGSMKNQEIEVTGRVFVMGHEPFTQVAVELADGRVFALIGSHDKDLRAMQGKKLNIKGVSRGKTPQGVETIEVKEFAVMEGR